MVYINPNFLVLHFGEYFVKKSEQKYQSYICKKDCIKLENEHSHFNAFFHELLWWVIKATNMLQLYTTNFFLVFYPFKMTVKFF